MITTYWSTRNTRRRRLAEAAAAVGAFLIVAAFVLAVLVCF